MRQVVHTMIRRFVAGCCSSMVARGELASKFLQASKLLFEAAFKRCMLHAARTDSCLFCVPALRAYKPTWASI